MSARKCSQHITVIICKKKREKIEFYNEKDLKILINISDCFNH